ncbi:type II toxin-antitoxin system HicA family toxin [Desulfobacca acetoxidans]
MSGKYPPLTPAEIEDILRQAGFFLKRTAGSHNQWEGQIGGKRRLVTVDHLSRRSETFGSELMASMIRQSGMTKDKFYSYHWNKSLIS